MQSSCQLVAPAQVSIFNSVFKDLPKFIGVLNVELDRLSESCASHYETIHKGTIGFRKVTSWQDFPLTQNEIAHRFQLINNL